jgi:hypothetical protein
MNHAAVPAAVADAPGGNPKRARESDAGDFFGCAGVVRADPESGARGRRASRFGQGAGTAP